MLHGAYATADRKRFRLRNSLVAAQVALSLMLVVTALLFVRSLEKAATTDPGFTTANIEMASVDVSMSGYRESTGRGAGASDSRSACRSIAGVESVAHARMIPLQGSGFGLGSLRVPGATGPAERRPLRRRLGRRLAWILRNDRHADRRWPGDSALPIATARHGWRSSTRPSRARRGRASPASAERCMQRIGDNDRARRADRRRRPRREVSLHQQRKRAVHLRADGAAAHSRRSSSTSGTRRAATSARRSGRRWRRSNRTCRSSCCNRLTMRRRSACCRRSSRRGSPAASARSASSSPRWASMV